MNNIIENIKQLAFDYCNCNPVKIKKLSQSGSNRQYFRLFYNDNTIIGVYNGDIAENLAFFHFTNVFIKLKINTPKIFLIDKTNRFYLLNDLGDDTLYSIAMSNKDNKNNKKFIVDCYKKCLSALLHIQNSINKIDTSFCYPRNAFDRQSMQWDLNYFKYSFLKLANIDFNEQKLEDDFNTLINFLLEADGNFFMFRDFQPRNIMIYNDIPYFIDYQGGRKGALQYDVASLLFDGKDLLSGTLKEKLLNYYITEAESLLEIDRYNFLKYFYSFVLIRRLQALGAYGFRGYYERKALLLKNIPSTLKIISSLLNFNKIPLILPELFSVLKKAIDSETFYSIEDSDSELKVAVNSFSYKKGIPQDLSGNGGGFVFDCRALPNPGREEKYALLSGKDTEIINYINSYADTEIFSNHVFAIVDSAVENYMSRKFTHLMVNFGCTGGRHRSVFFAEKMASHLKEKYPNVKIIINHANPNI